MADIAVDGTSFDRIMLRLENMKVTGSVTADITVGGKPADYYAPTEFGSGVGRRPWPHARTRTVESGGRVFSSQAVGGYVHRNYKEFVDIMRRAYTDHVFGYATRENLIEALDDAGTQITARIVAGAPYASGELRSSIKFGGAK